MNKKILVVHPTGNQNSKAVARGLSNSGHLHTFITALSLNTKNWRWLPNKLTSEITRRDFADIEGRVVSSTPLREGLRLLVSKLKLSWFTRHELGFSSVDAVYHATDSFSAKYLKKHASEISAVYCYEDGALETFKEAKSLGIKCIYELPIGYWRTHQQLNEEESRLQPEWAHTWNAIRDSESKLKRKDLELALADKIIVASSFTQKTLQDYPKPLAPVSVVPYGCPNPIEVNDHDWHKAGEKLNVLYVGGLSQRKGLSYLLSAVGQLKEQIEFSVIGNGNALELIKNQLSTVNYLGTMPHNQVLEQMHKHDVLVFSSLFEGFGMVITEAMSQGMVVIATDHTALPDIADESSSILIPIRDPEAIKVALQELIDHPEKVQKLGKAAIQKAQAYQWKDYENRLVEVIQTL